MEKRRKIFGISSLAGLALALAGFIYACIDTGIDVNSATNPHSDPRLYNGSAFWYAFFWNNDTWDTAVLVGAGLALALIFLIHFLFYNDFREPMKHRSKIFATFFGMFSSITAVWTIILAVISGDASHEESQVGWYLTALGTYAFMVICVWMLTMVIIEWIKNKSVKNVLVDIILAVAGFLPLYIQWI